ncbi:MAG: translation elongation factor Ts [Clostridia bacterium]|nr:translation elongation factor Ts [Clostridia bacterium]
MAFTAKDVVNLREKTGAGMLDCKQALTETNGDIDKAVEYLRKKGVASASKKAGRVAAEGAVFSYIHMGGKIGVLLELNCETDFVAKSDAFQELGHDIALQIAAAAPKYVSREEVDPSELAKEQEILRAQALNEGKPEAVVEKMLAGRINKFYKDVCLLDQEYVKDNTKTIQAVVNEAIAKIGEKISVRRFVRYVMGEGLEKRNDNLAEEVAKTLKA